MGNFRVNDKTYYIDIDGSRFTSEEHENVQDRKQSDNGKSLDDPFHLKLSVCAFSSLLIFLERVKFQLEVNWQ